MPRTVSTVIIMVANCDCYLYMHTVLFPPVDSKGNLEYMRKVQKGKMEGVGMAETLAYEKWVKDPGTLTQIRN